jgi:aminoglycoside phosphotransferase (APT) family kinase protein
VSVRGIDEEAVTAWLAERLPDVTPPLRFAPVGDGRSNLTYRVRDARERSWVLRRPPTGPLLPSAHDMAREHLVQERLGAAGLPVPRQLALCEDPEVTGAPFYVMEHVEGIVVARREVAAALPEEVRAAAGPSLADALARLHAVDVDAAGLGGLARHDGYAARQLKRWGRQWEASRTRDVPAVERVAARLAERAPEQREVSVVHGDFRLDNAILDERGRVRAVLDWELCTLGDPLADLGTLLMYWTQEGDAVAPLGDPATTLPGFATRAELAEAYARASGRDVSELDFWRALATWKLAVILQGVFRRWRDGQAAYPGIGPQTEELVVRLAAEAEAIAP